MPFQSLSSLLLNLRLFPVRLPALRTSPTLTNPKLYAFEVALVVTLQVILIITLEATLIVEPRESPLKYPLKWSLEQP